MQAWKNNGTILSDKGFQLKTCANPKEIDDEFVHDKSDFSLLDLWEKVHPKTIQRQNPSHLKKTRNNLFDVFRNSKYFNRKQKQAANQMILATSATQNDAAITKSRSFCIRPAVPVE